MGRVASLHTSARLLDIHLPPSLERKKKTIKELLREYGRPAVAVYMGVGTAILGCCYVAVLCHVDVPWLLEQLGLTLPAKAGNLLVAYILAKVSAPRLCAYGTCGAEMGSGDSAGVGGGRGRRRRGDAGCLRMEAATAGPWPSVPPRCGLTSYRCCCPCMWVSPRP